MKYKFGLLGLLVIIGFTAGVQKVSSANKPSHYFFDKESWQKAVPEEFKKIKILLLNM